MTRPQVVPFRPAGPVRKHREPLLRDVVGQILRDRRKDQGRTLEDVATAARVSTPYLSEVERGRKEPSSEVLAAICGSLGLSLADLVGEVWSDLSATTSLASAPMGTTNAGASNVVSLMVA